MTAILDRLDEIEAQAPAIAGRLDHGRVSAIGHSMGGQTVGMLPGARLTDGTEPAATDVDLSEPRIAAGILMGAPGDGGDSLSETARRYTFTNPDFSHMTTRTLVVIGDSDVSPHLTTRGADWHAEPFRHGPGADALLTIHGGKHGFGGIAGYDAKETDDQDPDHLALVLSMTWAYLRSALAGDHAPWSETRRALTDRGASLGRVDLK